MNLSHWFRDQLQASAEGFVWAVHQVPEEQWIERPLTPFGEWSVARHTFHMLFYEQYCALPSMRQWLAASQLDVPTCDEEGTWANNRDDVDQLLAQYQAIRDEQIALLSQFQAATWEQVRETMWGLVSLRWVVTKTYQHTAQHTHDVLRIALYWDRLQARNRVEQARSTT